MLNPEEIYYRKKNILYNSKNKAVVKFSESSADVGNLTGNLVENMNNYIRCYPERIEIFSMESSETQLTLF